VGAGGVTAPPASWQDTGYARIDSTVTKIGDYYYRFTKNEEGGAAGPLEAGKDIFLERSKVLTAPTTASSWTADPTTWQLLDTHMTSLATGQAGEGPEIVKLNAGDPNKTGDGYVFLVDNYGAGGYRAFVASADAIASSTQSDQLSQRADWSVRAPGGLPESPRHGAFVSVPQTVLTAMPRWRASAWSVQVLVSRGGASVVVPAGIRTVTAQYDGYRDQLVQVSSSDAVTLADVVVTPDPEPSPVPTDGAGQSGTGQPGTAQSDPGAASLATSGQSPVLITAASMLAALLLVAGAVLLIGRRRIRNG